MINFPTNNTEKREYFLGAIREIGPTLRECAVRNEELGTLAQPAVTSLQQSGMLRLKLGEELGGAQADPCLQMDVLEELAYHDLTAAWVTMVGTTGLSVLGAFLPESGVQKIFANGIPRASVQPAPMAEAIAVAGGYRVTGRWRRRLLLLLLGGFFASLFLFFTFCFFSLSTHNEFQSCFISH